MTAGSIAVPTIVPLRAPVPGKLKNIIDTVTPIELRTETPGAEIFFTIDGSKPDHFAAIGVDRNTMKYSKPFKLREGKITVKALAVSRDGTRESHIVTKCFEVEKNTNEKENLEKNTLKKDTFSFIDDLERERKKELIKKRGILKKIVESNNLSYRSDGGSISDPESARYGKETKFLGARFSKTSHQTNESKNSTVNFAIFDDELNTSNRKIVLPDSSTQTLRLQRETDFLKCIYCFATRPQDPSARYCSECGKNLPSIPQTKMVPPTTGQLGTCFYCRSIVPFNTSICVICENPINPQLQPQASIKLQPKVSCSNCTTSNPANYTNCVACDIKLIPANKVHPVDLALNVPQFPTQTGKSATCSQCFRINRNDARFCDWCGAKPQRQINPLECVRCGASNHPYTKFCSTCGTLIQPPSNQNPSATVLASTSNTQPSWLSNIDSKAMSILNKQYNTTSTQTYGLYYTSSKGLENKLEKEEKGLKLDREFLERRPALTAISAGRGYWRQQMDHICAHLKAFAHNNAEFRALAAEPRLGKINTAKVDIDSSWFTITATFPIRNNNIKDGFNSSSTMEQALKGGSSLNKIDYDYINAKIAGRDSSLSDTESASENDSYRSEESKKPRKKKVEKYEDRLSGEDRQLIKELGKNGRGRTREVEYLLKEGANPNAKTKDGLSMLHLAIRNRHIDAIPVLIKQGADIKCKIPPRGNTVLHEAVLLGSESTIFIKLLLDNGASPSWKNSKNEKPFDLAIKENNTAAVNLLNEQVGNDMISIYLKNRPNEIKP